MNQKQEFLTRFEQFLDGLRLQQRLFGIYVTSFAYTVVAKGFITKDTLDVLPGSIIHTKMSEGLPKGEIMEKLESIIEDFDDREGITDDGHVAIALFIRCGYCTSDRPNVEQNAPDIPVWKNPDEEFINIALDYEQL